jgi:hypothetical protein
VTISELTPIRPTVTPLTMPTSAGPHPDEQRDRERRFMRHEPAVKTCEAGHRPNRVELAAHGEHDAERGMPSGLVAGRP